MNKWFKVHYTNHSYWAEPKFETADEALTYGKTKGFEFSVHECEPGRIDIVYGWSPISGQRYYR
jgi:hypothetical protein